MNSITTIIIISIIIVVIGIGIVIVIVIWLLVMKLLVSGLELVNMCAAWSCLVDRENGDELEWIWE